MAETGIGAAVRRKEDYRFLTGRGRYTDDISRPGQVYAYFLRSPHAHATLNRINTDAAGNRQAWWPFTPVATRRPMALAA